MKLHVIDTNPDTNLRGTERYPADLASTVTARREPA
jgi:hypothetical protein